MNSSISISFVPQCINITLGWFIIVTLENKSPIWLRVGQKNLEQLDPWFIIDGSIFVRFESVIKMWSDVNTQLE